MTDPAETPKRSTVRELVGWERYLCLVVAAGGLLGGGVPVFRSTNQAGTVAILTVGSVASLLALVGKVPLRWVIGGNEIDMSYVEDVVEALADEMTPQQMVSAFEKVDPAGNPLNRWAASSIFELAGSAFMNVFVRRHPDWEYTDRTGSPRASDGLLRHRDGSVIAVEFKFWRSNMVAPVAQVARQLASYATDHSGLLLVTRERLSASVQERMRGDKPIEFVTLDDSDEVVAAALRKLLEHPHG